MQSPSTAPLPGRPYRAESVDGYVHKFRLESSEAGAIPDHPSPSPSGESVDVGWLLAKFAAAALALSALLFAGARALG